jgi:DNA-binding response OmpR family regulator
MSNPKIDVISIPEILVVEDSPTQAEELKYLLERHFFKIRVAVDGKQALAFIAERQPALVISDIIMPVMNGYELCRQIRANESTKDIPVILLTLLSSTENVLEGLTCGADSFITKPYNEDYLFQHVTKVLANYPLDKNPPISIRVEISALRKYNVVSADPQRMLNLLISLYEAAVCRNNELIHAQNELRLLNERLESLVEERTAALSAEIAKHRQADKNSRKSDTKI